MAGFFWKHIQKERVYYLQEQLEVESDLKSSEIRITLIFSSGWGSA